MKQLKESSLRYLVEAKLIKCKKEHKRESRQMEGTVAVVYERKTS